MKQFQPYHHTAVVLVLLIYVAVRLWGLTGTCLWFDEIFSVHAAEHAWNELYPFVALDLIHPPLFYILLKLWIAAGGEGLLWLRLLPAVFSIVAIVPFVLLCSELSIKFWPRILALFLLATNGCLIKYAQEVRMYSLLMCLSLFSLWLFVRFFRTGRGVVPLISVNLLVVYTHYFGWLIVLAEVVAVLMIQRARWRQIAVMTGILILGFLPWVFVVWQPAVSGSLLGQNIGWMVRPDGHEIAQFLLDLVEPFYQQPTTADAASDYRVSVPLLLIFVIALIVYLSKLKAKSADENETLRLLAIFAGVPVAAAFFASWLLPYSIWGTRHLIMVFPIMAILAASAITAMRIRWLRIAFLTFVILLTAYAFVLQTRGHGVVSVWCGFEALGENVLAKSPNGPVYVFEDLAAYHLWFAFRNNPDLKMRQRVVKLEGIPGIAEDKAFFLPRGLDDEYVRRESRLPLDGQIWIVYRAPTFDLTKPPMATFLERGFEVERSEVVDSGESKEFAVFLRKRDQK